MRRASFNRKNDEQIREIVASILQLEISDPRVAGATVTGAKVSPDKSVASLYVSAEPSTYESVLAGLASSKSRIRHLLGARLTWRVTPELRFFIDDAIDESERIGRALLEVPPTMRAQDEEADAPSAEPEEDSRS